MRQPQHRNRSRMRSRRQPNPANKVYESNGPDVKVRGTPQQIADKYMQLGRDALSAGDTVKAENYFQHAEHYLRIIAAAQEQMLARRQQQEQRRQEAAARRRSEALDKAAAENAPMAEENDEKGAEVVVLPTEVSAAEAPASRQATPTESAADPAWAEQPPQFLTRPVQPAADPATTDENADDGSAATARARKPRRGLRVRKGNGAADATATPEQTPDVSAPDTEAAPASEASDKNAEGEAAQEG